MNRILIAVIAALLWTVAAGFVGWQIRDGSADTVVAKTEAATQGKRAEVSEKARGTDQASAQGASKVEVKRLADSARNAGVGRSINQEVNRYGQANPATPGDSTCDADAHFMRIWRAANAGESPGAGPVDTSDTDGAGNEDAAATVGSEQEGAAIESRRSDGDISGRGDSLERAAMHAPSTSGRDYQWWQSDVARWVRERGTSTFHALKSSVKVSLKKRGSFPGGWGLRGR